MFDGLFSKETLNEAWRIIEVEFPTAIWETVYVTLLATAFSILIGLPLGVLLVVGEKEVKNGEISVRKQGEGDKGSVKISTFAENFSREIEEMTNY